MANFYDASVVGQDDGTPNLSNLWHAVAGLYVWEFVTTLNYEWKVIRGRIPYRWTIWIYSLTRVAGLLGIILSLVGADIMAPINCQLWVSSIAIFTYLSSAAASLLIVLRIIAIWNRNKIITAVAIFVWGVNVVFLIQGGAQVRSTWAPTQLTCAVANTKSNAFTLVAMVITDIALLVIMLVGLHRLRRHGSGAFGLTHLLWKQGVYWLLLATAAGVPPTIFNFLDSKDQLSSLLQAPALITMAIAGTRMHRSLVDFSSGPLEVYETSVFTLPKAEPERTHATSVTLSRMGPTVGATFAQHPTPQTNRQGPCINTDENSEVLSLREKVDPSLQVGDDVEVV